MSVEDVVLVLLRTLRAFNAADQKDPDRQCDDESNKRCARRKPLSHTVHTQKLLIAEPDRNLLSQGCSDVLIYMTLYRWRWFALPRKATFALLKVDKWWKTRLRTLFRQVLIIKHFRQLAVETHRSRWRLEHLRRHRLAHDARDGCRRHVPPHSAALVRAVIARAGCA